MYPVSQELPGFAKRMVLETGFDSMVFSHLLKHHPAGARWARMGGTSGLEPDPPGGLGTRSPVLRLPQTPPRGGPNLQDWKLLQLMSQSCWPPTCGN